MGILFCNMILKLVPILFVWMVIIQVLHAKSVKRSQKFSYPVARRDESIVETHYGKKIVDPYRWLEDSHSQETKQYVEVENRIAQEFLEKSDQWHKINRKLTKLWNYPKYNTPKRHGNYYFSYINAGLQNQNVLFKQDTLSSELTEFLNPNNFSSDGTVALNMYATLFSNDGSLLAYGLTESGSDWITIKVRDVETGNDYPDTIKNVRFYPMSWTIDNKGFFYGRFPDSNESSDGSETLMNHKVYYHRVGEAQENDVLVVEFPEHPMWRMEPKVSDCGKYLFLMIDIEIGTRVVYFADLQRNGEIIGKIPFTPIVSKFENIYFYVTNTGSKAIFRTDKNAPNFRLISIDLNNYAEENWTTLVPEHKKDVLDWVYCVDTDKLVISYLRDVKSSLQVHSLADGKLLREFPLEIGQIIGFSGEKNKSEIFYQLESFLTPGIIYRYDFAEPNTVPAVLREMEVPLSGFDKNNYKVEQVFYPSRDGTKIPMFIVQKKSDRRQLKPCRIFGYGGFTVPLLPTFNGMQLFFIESFDGVLAFPNIRGGGEYGESWHSAGCLLNKQNSFDDFQAAAEYLVKHKYTEHKKIAIQGASNGGLLVGACINQRPDLFGAAVAQVGVMDMLRYHKLPIGMAWFSEYGNPDEKIHFENLIKFSPLHNVQSPNNTANQYPATLLITADHDDRVRPLHSLKLTATMQNAVRDKDEFQTNPILLRVYNNAGHGAGKPTVMEIKEATDVLTFLYQVLHIEANF